MVFLADVETTVIDWGWNLLWITWTKVAWLAGGLLIWFIVALGGGMLVGRRLSRRIR